MDKEKNEGEYNIYVCFIPLQLYADIPYAWKL